MANPEDALRPGLFARVDLGISTRPGVAVIPEDAVLQRADGAVVFRFGAENRVERRVIEVGVIRGGVVEVISGVSPGDVVVLRGHSRLVDGDLVAPRDGDRNRTEIADARETGS
jgi:membrane fusion protein (multidrug efflux system)